MARRKPQTSAKSQGKRLKTQADTAEALRLRMEGVHVREISKQLGRSTGWVSENVNRAIREVPFEAADEYRAIVLSREESLIASHWPKREIPEHAKIVQASDKMLIDLLGLASPTKTQLTGANGGPIATVDIGSLTDEQLKRLAAGDLAALAGDGGDGAPSPGNGGSDPTGA